ncbi:MAG: hypothetical protein ACI9M9_001958 [Flavobacteriaceae bacterium]|jgi:hypothetical protein
MENDNSRAIISDLIFLAYADGKLTDSEYDFILQIALRLDLNELEVQKLFDKPTSSRLIFTELERISHFYKLVLLMNVDMETHEKEVIAIRNFGLKMGIRAGVFDQILLQMGQYKNKIIPSDDLVNIFRTYYN